MSWHDSPDEKKTRRDRMPYIQVETDLWIVMREHKTHPKAVIQRITARDQTSKYVLLTWNEEPSKRRMHGMYDSLEEANFQVRWPIPQNVGPGLPPNMRPRESPDA